LTDHKEPVSAPLRRLGAALLTTGRIRLELLAIEAQEEKERIASLLVWAVFAALLAGFGLLMLVLLVIVALWDSYRLGAIAGAAVVLLAGAAFVIFKLKAMLAQPSTLFEASIAELRQDADALRRHEQEPRPGP